MSDNDKNQQDDFFRDVDMSTFRSSPPEPDEELPPLEYVQNVSAADGDESLTGTDEPEEIDLSARLRRGETIVYESELDEQETREDGEPMEHRDYMPVRFRRYGKLGCMGGLMYAAFIISASVILACLGWMFAADVLALNKEPVSAVITIPESIYTDKEVDVKDEDGNVVGTETLPSADIDYIAHQLKDAGIIEYQFLFKLFSKVSKADLKINPGSYELSTALDYRALVKNMQTGTESQLITKLTFPEGYTCQQIFAKLEENGICDVAELEEAAANYNYSYSFLDGIETGEKYRLEGFLFPDTYDFYQGEQASSVVNKMLADFHYRLTADMLAQCENQGITLREALIIASLIEKEAADDEDRYTISSVIHNRLDDGMPLQLDSTLNYIFGESTFQFTYDQIEYDSPYNTYKYTGLPPGPICNPGMASILAALSPYDTSYYYYALNTETGSHEYFTNSTDFNNFLATQDYSTLG